MASASVLWIFCISVTISNAYISYKDHGFYYSKTVDFYKRAGEEECSMCYGRDCLFMDQARCEFYTSTSGLVDDDAVEDNVHSDVSSEQIRREVDNLMISLMEQAASTTFQECIPFISKYTDCTKENTCLGCTHCSCDEEGRWNCSKLQKCRPTAPVYVDHRALVVVMEKLKNKKILYSERDKRSIGFDELNNKADIITYNNLSQWMYGEKPFYGDNSFETNPKLSGINTVTISNDQLITGTDVSTPNYNMSSKAELDNLAFDDVLSNIGVEDKIYNRRKPLNRDMIMDHVYMNFKYSNASNNNVRNKDNDEMQDNYFNFINAIEDYNEYEIKCGSNYTTDVVIDLLEETRKKIGADRLSTTGNWTGFKETFDDNSNTAFKNANDINENMILNIQKRDISGLTNDSVSSTTKQTAELIKDTNSDEKLKIEAHTALEKVLFNKQQELKDLFYVREKLLEYAKEKRNETFDVFFNNSSNASNISNTHFSFFNINLVAKPNTESEIYITNSIEKQVSKLKRDIVVVIKDIVDIQKEIGKHNFPPDLKILIRAMKHYVHATGKFHHAIKNKTIENNLRRNLAFPYPSDINLVQNYLTDILRVIDKDIPLSNALSPLSFKCKDIMKRVINNHNNGDTSIGNLKINELEDKFSVELASIGIKWQNLTANVLSTPPAYRLYHMKLLHLTLLSDIDKITDTLSLMNFANSRRIITLQDGLSNNELKRINDDLKSIHKKINRILEFQPLLRNISEKKITQIVPTRTPKKETILKHIRNLLRNSKKDIMKLLRKRIPKSEIVKELAKKKLDELTKKNIVEYETIMRKWQANLNVNRRKKRTLFNLENMKSKIKNILPKYLRGKVHSGIQNTTKTKKKYRNMSYRTQNKRFRNKTKHQMSTIKAITITGTTNVNNN